MVCPVAPSGTGHRRGMALALAGVVMQAIVKNPLADPYVLGVSSGASWAPPWRSWWGWALPGQRLCGPGGLAGAFLVSIGVIALANIGGRATSVKLILAGTALSAICAAVSNFFLYVINTSSGALEAVVRWTMGSLAAASWDTNSGCWRWRCSGRSFSGPSTAP